MGLVRIALAVAALAAITACSGPVKAVPASYYLALGDSLSQGVQPDMAGANVETRQGYADQLGRRCAVVIRGCSWSSSAARARRPAR